MRMSSPPAIAPSACSHRLPGSPYPRPWWVPANANSATFCYTLSSTYDWHQVYDVNATLDGSTATAYGSQAYTLGFAVSLSSSNAGIVYGGQNTPSVTVTVTPQPGYSSTVNLSCDNLPVGASCQFSPSQFAIAPGAASSATLVVTTGPGYFSGPIVIVASDGNVIQRQSFTLNLASLNISSKGGNSVEEESPGVASAAFQVAWHSTVCLQLHGVAVWSELLLLRRSVTLSGCKFHHSFSDDIGQPAERKLSVPGGG